MDKYMTHIKRQGQIYDAFIEGYLQLNQTFEIIPHSVIQTDISSAKGGEKRKCLDFEEKIQMKIVIMLK